MKTLLLFVFSVLLSLGFAEITVRSLELTPVAGILNIGHYQISENPLIRYEHKKNAKAHIRVPQGDYRAFMRAKKNTNCQPAIFTKGDYRAFIRENLWDTFHTNSWGFRDCEHPLSKPDAIVRIAVLGDSITAALNLNRNVRYTELLENYLNQGYYRKKHVVMNFGVSGYDTLQEVATLKDKVLPFAPDIVVVAYCLNDNIPDTDGALHGLLLEQLTSDQRTWLDAIYHDFQYPILRLLHRSQLYTLVRHLYVTRFKSSRWVSSTDRFPTDIVGQAFSMLSNIQKDEHFKVLIVIFPYFKQLFSYPFKAQHQEVKDKAKPYAFDILDLFECYVSRASDGAKEFRHREDDFCHPNEFGHRIAAEAIYKALKEKYPDIIN
jgi:lysophospholipase L1-like esterase